LKVKSSVGLNVFRIDFVQIVQEWVRQISHHQQYQHQDASKRMADDEDLELERFALDIAESLVSSMEKSAGIQTKVCPFTVGTA
jgi:hypothetical protein